MALHSEDSFFLRFSLTLCSNGNNIDKSCQLFYYYPSTNYILRTVYSLLIKVQKGLLVRVFGFNFSSNFCSAKSSSTNYHFQLGTMSSLFLINWRKPITCATLLNIFLIFALIIKDLVRHSDSFRVTDEWFICLCICILNTYVCN